MSSGKLDEQLSRMSSIVDSVKPNNIVSAQRVIRVDERARRLADRVADYPGAVGSEDLYRLIFGAVSVGYMAHR